MAKRKTEIVNWVLIAALLLCCAAGFAVQKHSGTVSALLCSPEKFESLQAERTPSETALVTGLSIGGTQLVQDRETGVYY